MQASKDIRRHVIGHHACEELDLTLVDDLANEEVSLMQHDKDTSDLVLLSYEQAEDFVKWWEEHHG